MTTDVSDELFWKHLSENLVPDPKGNDLLDISKMDEKELVELFDQTWAKVKRLKIKHSSEHGWLLNCATILKRLYTINLHKWGRDEGYSGEALEKFKAYLREGFDPSKRGRA